MINRAIIASFTEHGNIREKKQKNTLMVNIRKETKLFANYRSVTIEFREATSH
jgi:isocitrate/isopropylmalate dehydrogenase